MTSIELLKKIVDVSHGFACTTFTLKNKGVLTFGRNFDFMIGLGHVVINKRNVSKKAFVAPKEKQLSWTSKYGSLTFNQVGREFPYGGVNETGLVIEQLWLESTQYPKSDDRYALPVLQWIQYHLDMSKSIEDVIKSDSKVRILDDAGANLHFFLTDRTGKTACIEYMNGEMECVKESAMPYPVLTNHSYSELLEYMAHPSKVNNSKDLNVFTGHSLQRFYKASNMLEQKPNMTKEDTINYAFEILDQVSQKGFTQWSIVYDILNMEVRFKTLDQPSISVVKLEDIDFSSHTPCLVYNLDTKSQDKVEFVQYSSKANRALINQVFDRLEMLKDVPNEIRMLTADYPTSTIFND